MLDDRIVSALAALRALAADNATSYETLVAEARALMTLAPVSVGTSYPRGLELYRGTSYHTSVPLRVGDLSYPPAERVTYGRANCPGRPIFDCSPDPTGVFKELRARAGQYAVLAKWTTTQECVVHGVGYSASAFERAAAPRPAPEPYQEFDKGIDANTLAVREFIALEFTTPNTSDYRLTAALAEVLLAGDYAGVIYPATATDFSADNLALLPSFVDTSLRLTDAQLILIEDFPADGSVAGQVIARLDSVDEGSLKWIYTGTPSDSAPVNVPTLHRIERGQRTRFPDARSVTINGQDYDVQPGYSIEVFKEEVCVVDLQRKKVTPTGGTKQTGSFWPRAYGDNVNRYLTRFGSLFAISAEAIEIRGTRVAIGVYFRGVLTISEPRWNLQMAEGLAVELHDPTISPEGLVRAQLVHWISQRHPASGPTGIVVEAEPGTLDEVNARRCPIADSVYLPENFELIYACRGSEREVAANAMLAFCRSQCRAFTTKLERDEFPELIDRVASRLFSRGRWFEIPAPAGK